MKIRAATVSDVPQLIALGEEFARVSFPIHRMTVSPDRIAQFTHEQILNPDCIKLVLVEEDVVFGLLVALVTKPFFSDDIVLQELVWYVKERHRGGLLLLVELEKEARARGVSKMVMGYKPGFVDMKKIYDRQGFNDFEIQCLKELF
jgi:hypothetical protein